ncbi:MAG: universal stress protein [Micromonosporaceae bacterium]|nr:universal stress protein [Micromonosporaceae bacterium]
MHTAHSVVAGFDGSPDSRAAVEYAASAARDLGLPLRVIHCYAWSEAQTAVFHAAGRMLADLCETLEPHYPGLDFQPVVLSRSPAAALIGESRTAELVVIGHEGMGTFGGLHTGAVARQVVNQSYCPVVVTRGTELPRGPVVVSIGNAGEEPPEHPTPIAEGHHAGETNPITQAAHNAIKFAFIEAARREVALYAIRLASDPVLGAQPVDTEFAESLARWHGEYPKVEVHDDLVPRDEAVQRLLEAGHNAGLLIVGASMPMRGRGMRLGPLPATVLSTATCPVAIVESCPP